MDKITPPQNTKENENRENTQNNNYFKEHLTHYKKIKLTKDISLRYFYSYQQTLQRFNFECRSTSRFKLYI